MIKEQLKKQRIYFDGGMGTLLQEKGLAPGELPEIWNLTHEKEIEEIHSAYIEAGSEIILANTFGANALKFHDKQYDLKDIVFAAIRVAKRAVERSAGDRKVYVALDVGPTGRLLKPLGDLEFEDACKVFREVIEYGAEAGADLIHIETMSDTYEMKAAVLAAKEATDLPVFATAVFDERKKLLTGADVPSVVAMLEGLRVDAMGVNCGLGPKQMLPVVEQFLKYASVPLIVKPNAGLPVQENGITHYDVTPDEFARCMKQIAEMGACIIGGCCGTTPEHIRKMKAACDGVPYKAPEEKGKTLVSSYGGFAELGTGSKIIGERINPTGKKRFKQALKENDIEYILNEGIREEDQGAHILDVNVGLPDIDEVAMMREVIQKLQAVTSLPLQIDTADGAAMEQAMRIYNGKPMVNSVNGKQESMDMVFPLVKRYGGVVVGLTLDEGGIPETVQGRVDIAEKIIKEAAKYGIQKKDLVIDVLTMAVSSVPDGAKIALEALHRVRYELGVNTVLGVSNISFGLPQRPVINAGFYMMAMQQGLSAGIINPGSEDMMRSYFAYHALMNLDENCEHYIERYHQIPTQDAGTPAAPARKKAEKRTLRGAIEKGMKEEAEALTREMLETEDPLELTNQHLIPALDTVGKGFEKGTVFLPQLLMSAEAAKAAFAIIRSVLENKETEQTEKKEKIVLATVKGDIHDIGKNIVKVLLENYGFDVVDLGKDVEPEIILKTVQEQKVRLVGLSALMTTTVVSMEQTIKLIKEQTDFCKVMVGGAVLNPEYADMIGADFYGKDAMQSVYYAQELFGQNK